MKEIPSNAKRVLDDYIALINEKLPNTLEYALQKLPEEWHDIIHEAMNIRKGLDSGMFTSNQKRIESALQLSKYIIATCN